MQVILLKDVDKLGKAGDLVEVKPGYAQNGLIRRGLAAEATPQSINEYKTRKKAEAAKAQQELEDARATASRLKGKKLTLELKCGEGGRLYGAITNQNIADGLQKMGFSVDKRQITVKEAVKAVGCYEAEARLHPEVLVPFVLEIKASEV